ncbi:MAG: hypothetical protein ACK559_12585, partial [bacterium]
EIDPIVEDGLKWFDENPKETSETYKNKRKEVVDKIQPLLMKLQGNPMGGGMPPNFDPSMFSQKPGEETEEKEGKKGKMGI